MHCVEFVMGTGNPSPNLRVFELISLMELIEIFLVFESFQ